MIAHMEPNCKPIKIKTNTVMVIFLEPQLLACIIMAFRRIINNINLLCEIKWHWISYFVIAISIRSWRKEKQNTSFPIKEIWVSHNVSNIIFKEDQVTEYTNHSSCLKFKPFMKLNWPENWEIETGLDTFNWSSSIDCMSLDLPYYLSCLFIQGQVVVQKYFLVYMNISKLCYMTSLFLM